MSTKHLFAIALSILLYISTLALAQTPAPDSPAKKPDGTAKAEEQEAAKKAREKKALTLLEEVIGEAGSLKSLENRMRIQAIAADLLWSRNEKRARALMSEAISNFTEFAGSVGAQCPECYAEIQGAIQMRGQLLQIIARHDPALALEFLRSSRLQTASQPSLERFVNQMETEQEQSLATAIAQRDPKLAEQMAEESMRNGLSYNLTSVVSQLRSKDIEAAQKLAAAILNRLQSENLSANLAAFNVAVGVVRDLQVSQQDDDDEDQNSGSSANTPGDRSANSAQAVLKLSDLQDLAKRIVAAALTISPSTVANYYNAYMSNLQSVMTQLEKLVPEQAATLGDKITAFKEQSDPNNRAWNEIQPLLQNGSVDAILDAAAKAPEAIRQQVYQQAAMKAEGQGDSTRARQIVNDKISDPGQREQMLAQLDRQSFQKASGESKLDEARAALSRIRSPEERASFLIQLSSQCLQKGDKKTAMQLADEAFSLFPARAKNYNQIGIQLQIAQAYEQLDPSRTAAILGPVADQLNSLIAAAAVLEGFDIQNAFHEDELTIQSGVSVAAMVNQYAGELSRFAEGDMDGAAAMAARLERPEVRTFARLTIARGILDGQQAVATQYGFVRGYARYSFN
jgi:hypothetical protein